MNDIIRIADEKEMPIYLETSVDKNILWYKKVGFTIFAEIELTYKLFLLKRD